MSEGAGRLYAFGFQGVALGLTGGDQELFYCKPAADKVCQIEGVYLSNVGGSADAGDAQEELARVEMIRLPATVTVGSGGSSVATPSPFLVNDAAAGFTARVNDTTLATTSGTAVPIHSDGWNTRIPYVWLPPPEHRPMVANAQAIVLRLVTALADDITCDGTMLVRELP